MKIIMIDNYDSFTWNLVHLVKEQGADIRVLRNDRFDLEELADYDKIMLSPGPGVPAEAGLLCDVIRRYASSKPILGICRGEQLLNVVLGGSLIQDIPTQVDTVVKHSGGALHRIGVEKGSVLYKLFGEDSLTVNSSHHQAVNRVAPGVRVTAHAPDGIVEAYEYGDRLIAVQFHPEGMVRTDESWLALFRHFLSMVR